MLSGRDAEVRTLDRLLAGARIGESGVLLLTGEAGIGKTALWQHARASLEGFRELRATGAEAEREIPFAGLLALLRPALPQLSTIPGPQAAALGAALALRPGSTSDRFAIGAATLSLLCRYAEDGPVAVMVDDLQLLDRPSAEAIVFAARRLGADPVAVLLTGRSGEVDDEVVAGLPVLRLSGLDPGSARRLLDGAGDRVTAGQLARLHQATGGNPLALLELGEHADALMPTGLDLPLPVSAAVTQSFTRRLHQLDPGSRTAILVALVANGDLHATASACTRIGLDVVALHEAEESSLVSLAAGEVTFRHPLLRAAIYADASAEERRTAHRAVAETLPEEDADRRAWHLSESVWAPDDRIAELMEQAAVRAVHRAAYAVASSAFERAARLSADQGRRLACLLRAADAAWSAGMGPRALQVLDELDRAPGGPVMAGDDAASTARGLRAAVAARTGSLRTALEILEDAADRAPTAENRVLLLADGVHVSMYLADTASAVRFAQRITAELVDVTAAPVRAVGLVASGMAHVLAGTGGTDEIRAAVPLLADSIELRSDPRRLPWLMLAPLFLRDTGAGTELRMAVDEVRGVSGVGTLPFLLFHVARDQATTDSWARAEATYSEAIRLARETGQSTELAVSLAGLAWLESRQGNEEGCRTHAGEALPICAERGIHLGEVWASFALGDLELSLGDAAAAAERLQSLDARLEELGLGDPDLSPRPELVDALLRVGREGEARRTAHGFATIAQAKGQPWALARASRALGLVGDDRDLDRCFEEALRLHEHTPDRFETGRTRLAYGGRLRRAGRRVDARPHLREASALFTSLGAGRWADQADVELAATGEHVRPRPDVSAAPALTPQELQVSLLLAEGRTTRETAAALFLSPKTVEYHLRKVYVKLGIRSRAELAGRLPG